LKSIICPSCNTSNNPTFAVCWKCKFVIDEKKLAAATKVMPKRNSVLSSIGYGIFFFFLLIVMAYSLFSPNSEIQLFIKAMGWDGWLVFGLCIALWIFAWYLFERIKAVQMRKEMAELGFSFDETDLTLKNQIYRDFELLGERRLKFARNVCRIRYQNGVELTTVDFFAGLYSFTVFVFEIPSFKMPYFRLVPKPLPNEIENRKKSGGIKLTNASVAQNYLLFGKDQLAILAFFNSRRMKMFEQNPGFYVEGEDSYLAVTFKMLQLRPKHAEDFINNVARFAQDFVESGSTDDKVSFSVN